ncbi:N-acetylmuramoyl-L-alanine amidase [Paenibacillus sp.]|uniref:N-acetylmuramoyl-L-alanine amidase n=1 Tax=Paenibacillus sp. TaxID=58172 RepID=UPI002D43A55E|nr:N-acetylmuramoyl-L-alanine amidase [Paenibacillus sp.]HZG85473.1 N-acetylmuramoyl-L-alanine amidase [Paenibacillus sp.]
MAPILIIDPGHGGADPGGGSNAFWKEKDLVLQISLYQAERFEKLGVDVAMTRRTDVTISAPARTKIVRESGARYCISNHINAGGGDGVETIHSIHSDGKLARAIAEAIRESGQNLRRVFTRTLPGNPNRDYYFMHRETGGVETVIIEYGFADSKRDDVEQLRTHWKEYAEAVVRAFCSHIGHPYAPPRAVSAAEVEAAGDLPAVQARIGVVVDGVRIGEGLLIDNTSYVPARLIGELLGAVIEWDGANVVVRRKETT